MKSNAPGQLLGFSMQFPRALYHLLRSAPKDVVCVEVLEIGLYNPTGCVYRG